MVLSELSATALQADPVVLTGDTTGAKKLPDGTEAANRAAAEAVVKATQPAYNMGWLLALVGVVAVAYNVRNRKKRG
jgi:hypothetical protein